MNKEEKESMVCIEIGLEFRVFQSSIVENNNLFHYSSPISIERASWLLVPDPIPITVYFFAILDLK
jgi:hypothetical protein